MPKKELSARETYKLLYRFMREHRSQLIRSGFVGDRDVQRVVNWAVECLELSGISGRSLCQDATQQRMSVLQVARWAFVWAFAESEHKPPIWSNLRLMNVAPSGLCTQQKVFWGRPELP